MDYQEKQVKFMLTPIPTSTLQPVSPGFAARPVCERTIGTAELADTMVAMGTPVSRAVIALVLDEAFQKIPEICALTGCAVNLGNMGKIVPSIKGVFENVNSQFNSNKHKLQVRWATQPNFRDALTGVKCVNVGAKWPSPTISGQMDRETEETDTVVNGSSFLLTGRNLHIDQADLNQGVWIEFMDGQTLTQKQVTVQECTPLTITCLVNGVTPGEGKLIAKVTGSVDPACPVTTLYRKVKVLPMS